jgi:predicted MPP superfamily phosphohydrolase
MKLNRRQFLKTLGLVAAGGALLSGGGYTYVTQVETDWLVVERVQVPIKNLKPALEGFKIVHMSDLHLHPYTQADFVQKAVAIANRLNPDVVALTGDYVLETQDAIFELAPLLAGLNPRYGIFATLGNHDHWTNATVVHEGLTREGISVLHNEHVTLNFNGADLTLAGVDDIWSGRPDLKAALVAGPTDSPTILLAHEPDFADQSAQDGRVALQLSGHSHGGQVRLPGLGAPILPYLGQKYDVGLNQVNQMWVYTTRGVGLIGPPIRFNCPPEITEITLVAAP